MPGELGASTCKDDRIYLFVIQWPAEGPLKLPPLSQTITGSETQSGGKVAVYQSESEITVVLPASRRDPFAGRTTLQARASGST
jgi:hypothetical protein